MTRPAHDDEPELRQLLDAIGLTAADQSVATEHDPESYLRAQEMLVRITDQPRIPAPRGSASRLRPRRWTLLRVSTAMAVCVLAAIAAVIWVPGSGPSPAAAQTPPLLTFTRAGADDLRDAGEPARALLNELSERATQLPVPDPLPVQRIEAEAWWASTDPATETKGPRTVLVPRHLEVFQLDDGSRRSIERRGAAIDSHGRITDEPGSWNAVPPTTDETFTDDLGPSYPQSLPTSLAGLRSKLAPADSCGRTTGGCLLSAVNDLFAGYVVDPTLTARLWRLLATDPSITSLGDTTDRLGRRAEVFVADALDPTQRILILIDPTTGGYLGSETLLVRPSPDLGFRPPAVMEFIAIVGSARIAASDVPNDATTTRY